MQFMLFCCFDEDRWNALPQPERDGIMQRYAEWVEEMRAEGCYVSGGKLDESSTASNIRQRAGELVVMDGPFAEVREQVGGFHVIECRDRDEAIRRASRIPTLPAGGRVEIRPQVWALGGDS